MRALELCDWGALWQNRDENRWLKRDSQMRKVGFKVPLLWSVVIRPSFHVGGRLTLIQRVNFVGDEFEEPTLQACLALADGRLQHGPLQDDGVSEVLQAGLDLVSPLRALCLDGIGYDLEIHAHRVRTNLHFSNPRCPTLCHLEQAMLNVACQVCTEPDLVEWTQVWREYASKWHAP